MGKRPSENTSRPAEWLRFETAVAEAFRLFGYQVRHDTLVRSGQVDVLALPATRHRPRVLIECKHHKGRGKVGVADVDKFVARVIAARSAGMADQGYLVTNTGFTADAKGSLEGSPIGTFVFLATFDDLLRNLVDLEFYLSDFVERYTSSGKHEEFVPLSLIDTTCLPATTFDSLPGSQLPCASLPAMGVVIDVEHLERTIAAGIAVRAPLFTSHYVVDPQRLRDYAKRRAAAAAGDRESLPPSDSLHRIVAHAPAELIRYFGYSSRAELIAAAQQDPRAVLARIAPLPDSASPTRRRSRMERLHTAWIRQLAHVLTAGETGGAAPAGDPSTLGPFEPYILGAYDTLRRSGPEEHWPMVLLPYADCVDFALDFISNREESLLVLLGDFGAGKTTVMNRLMYELASRRLELESGHSLRTPLLINLREYNKVPDFKHLIRHFLAESSGSGEASFGVFRRLNESGHFVLLLDGFDEMLARVTRADRRRCFLEVAELLAPASKIVLTGRPAYFPEHDELLEVVEQMQQAASRPAAEGERVILGCLQLLDEAQVETMVRRYSPAGAQDVIRILYRKPDLMDLARRPVLAEMIAKSAAELRRMEDTVLTPRRVYEIYTDRWVRIEEDKGGFRILMDPEKKATFMRYLAMQMHLSGKLSVHFAELDREIAGYFHLAAGEAIDHFSHDIRTCSFLNRSDKGDYRFVHKSFMEFFVAVEFERLDESPFAPRFDVPLTSEMVAFLESRSFPERFRCLFADESLLTGARDQVSKAKDEAIADQDFVAAAELRDIEMSLLRILEVKRTFGRQMDLEPAVGSIHATARELTAIARQPVTSTHLAAVDPGVWRAVDEAVRSLGLSEQPRDERKAGPGDAPAPR